MIHSFVGFPPATSLHDLTIWMGSIILENTDIWFGVGAQIEKRGMKMASIFWFTFLSIILMPSQNESDLRLPKASFLASMSLLNSQKMAMRAIQKQTSLSFPVLVTELSKHV